MKQEKELKKIETKTKQEDSSKKELVNISMPETEESALLFFMNFSPKIPVSAYVAEVKASINK